MRTRIWRFCIRYWLGTFNITLVLSGGSVCAHTIRFTQIERFNALQVEMEDLAQSVTEDFIRPGAPNEVSI